MPHKHTRRGQDPSEYDLPPDKFAKPLPALSSKERREALEKHKKKRKPTAPTPEPEHARPPKKRPSGTDFPIDDAPRAFKRIMRVAYRKQAGTILATAPAKPKLNREQEKKKQAAQRAKEREEKKKAKEAEKVEKVEVPTILPGEKLSDFAARVDQAIPVVGLANKMQKNGRDVLGMKVARTRKEKKMHKLYEQWRAEEKKIQLQRDEDAEEAAERELDSGNRLMDNGIMDGFQYDSLRPTGRLDTVDGTASKKKKKKKQKRGGGKKKAEDPWAELVKRRGEGKKGLHDLVQAPPESNMKMQVKLKTHGKVYEH